MKVKDRMDRLDNQGGTDDAAMREESEMGLSNCSAFACSLFTPRRSFWVMLGGRLTPHTTRLARKQNARWARRRLENTGELLLLSFHLYFVFLTSRTGVRNWKEKSNRLYIVIHATA
jgi:hypothetical protein